MRLLKVLVLFVLWAFVGCGSAPDEEVGAVSQAVFSQVGHGVCLGNPSWTPGTHRPVVGQRALTSFEQDAVNRAMSVWNITGGDVAGYNNLHWQGCDANTLFIYLKDTSSWGQLGSTATTNGETYVVLNAYLIRANAGSSTSDTYSRYFQSAAEHEIGHALGLQHVSDGAVMRPSFPPFAWCPNYPDRLEFCRVWGCNGFTQISPGCSF